MIEYRSSKIVYQAKRKRNQINLSICLDCTGFCPNNRNADGPIVFSITFGNGSSVCSKVNAATYNFKTNHNWKKDCKLSPGEYCLSNKIQYSNTLQWHFGQSDHTENETNGCMYLLDVGEKGDIIFEYVVHNLTVETFYEFSAYLANVQQPDHTCNEPNVRFSVREKTSKKDIAQTDTESILECANMTWKKYGLSFNAVASSVSLHMITNEGIATGNNLAIDDIQLRTCSNQSLNNFSG